MEKVPVEIIERICSNLCLHCRSESPFVHEDTPDVVRDKAALARFSATCSSLRAIVQPILFHYFATGRAFACRWAWGIRSNEFPARHRDNTLPLFLRSTIERPDLALCVRSLELVSATPMPFHDNVLDTPLLEILNAASRRLGLEDGDMIPPTEAEWKRMVWGDGIPDGFPGYLKRKQEELYDTRMAHWLQELTLMLLPSVASLLLIRAGPRTHFRSLEKNAKSSRRVTLTALKRAVLAGTPHESWHIAHAGGFLKAAPNLEELYAIDCGNDRAVDMPIKVQAGYIDPENWYLPIAANLSRLHIEDVALEELRRLLLICPQLQELRYRKSKVTDWGYTQDRGNFCRQVEDALSPLVNTLRVLALTFKTETVRDDYGNLPTHYENSLLRDITHPISTLANFIHLDSLVIEQVLLYPLELEDDKIEPRIADILPPSIRRLSLTFVYRSFRKDMQRLVSEAPARFRRLEFIMISAAEPPSARFHEQVKTDWRTIHWFFDRSTIRLVLSPQTDKADKEDKGYPTEAMLVTENPAQLFQAMGSA